MKKEKGGGRESKREGIKRDRGSKKEKRDREKEREALTGVEKVRERGDRKRVRE